MVFDAFQICLVVYDALYSYMISRSNGLTPCVCLSCQRKHASSVCVPLFDRDTGLFLALGRCLSSKLEEKEGKLLVEPAPPHDKELLSAISKMVVRSRKCFK